MEEKNEHPSTPHLAVVLEGTGYKVPVRPRGLHDADGYVYVLQFRTGVVKVGATADPASRVVHLAATSRFQGNPVERAWVSPPHRRYWATEEHLIHFGNSHGEPVDSANEYFTGLDFESVVAHCEQLECVLSTPDEIAATAFRSAQHLESMKRVMVETWDTMNRIERGGRPMPYKVLVDDVYVAAILDMCFNPDRGDERFEQFGSGDISHAVQVQGIRMFAGRTGESLEDVCSWTKQRVLEEMVDIVRDLATTRVQTNVITTNGHLATERYFTLEPADFAAGGR